MPPVPSFRYLIVHFFGGSVDLAGVVEVTFCQLEHKPEFISRVRVERSCTSSSGTIPPGLYLITRTSSTRASSGDEPPEDLNPESHPDITGQRFLEVSWEGSLEWWRSPLK
ncbi:uncharacterized protein FOBCDRAFT_92621, partial [Fusarium oxysporum Fo47]|uniref:uncharacterized protein n=1 Tax=Fusarium oxysporum Fo47 TaxID=660027 RepID=UPI002869812B